MSMHPTRPIKEAFRGIGRHRLMSFASVTILAACMIIIGSVLLIILNLNTFVSQLQQQNEIVVFIDENASLPQTEQVGKALEKIENVNSVEFASRESALEEYKSMFGEQASLFDQFEDNPLRDSYHVKVTDLEQYQDTIDKIQKIENIANVRSSTNVVSMLVNLRSTISMLGIWVLVILLFVSIFIISNTVRLAMYSRRTEINIMKYVGATNGYIRRPFIWEGIIIGIIACIIGFGVQWYVYEQIIYPLITRLSLFQPVMFSGIKFMVLGGFAVFSIFMGVLGSILPMRKHLKV